MLTSSVSAVSDLMDTRTQGRSVVVYNPVAHQRESVVEIELEYEIIPAGIQVYDENGNKVPSQIIEKNDNKLEIIFLAKMQSVGLTVYDVRETVTPLSSDSKLSVTETTLENEYYLVKIATNGDILSVFDKKAQKEILEEPARLEFLYEEPDQWPAWNMDWNDRQNPAVGYMTEAPKLRILEQGPVRVAIEITREGKNSSITQVISLAAGEAGKVVEVSNLVNWQSSGVSLKAAFPLSVHNEMATYNLGVGTIQRGNNDSNKFEVPSKYWFDLTEESGAYGVSILEDCKYGSDKPADNVMRLTLLFTPKTHSWYPVQNSQDWGIHEFRYGIYGHKGSWQKAQTNMLGDCFNEPLLAFEVSKHNGTFGKNFCFLSTNKDELGLMACKKMEDVDGYYIVRVNELVGDDVKGAEIEFPWDIVDAFEVNGQEKKVGGANFRRNRLSFDLSHYTIRSFAVKLKSPSNKETYNQQSVQLPYNEDVMSFDVNRHDGNFAWRRSLPAELIPAVIVSEGVRFEMGSREDRQNNAVGCKGQVIDLPDGNNKSLYILAAAMHDTNGEFIVDGVKIPLDIQGFSGFIGQFYNREFAKDEVTVTKLEDAFVKEDNIAWFASHCHKSYPSENESYQYCYLYKYELKIPVGARTIQLPDDPRIKVLAISVGEEASFIKPLQPLMDDFDYGQNIDLRD